MDLDGDGVTDLLSGSWPGEIFFFRGKGKGDFAALEQGTAPPSLIRARGRAIPAGSPLSATRWMTGPPGKPRPRSLATLSNASPAASSRVWPTRAEVRGAGAW